MEWIKKIQENEDEWIQIIQKMGESFYAKDIVQEFYLSSSIIQQKRRLSKRVN